MIGSNDIIKRKKKDEEKKEKAHAINIIKFFCVELLLERHKKGKKKNRNQRVSLSRSSFRSTNVLYSTCLGALVCLRSPPSSLEFNFSFSFSLSCIRPLEIGFFLFLLCMLSFPGQFSFSSSSSSFSWVDGVCSG